MHRGVWPVLSALLATAVAVQAAAPADRVPGELKPYGFDRIVFVRRNTCTSDHYYTDHINDRSKPGGNLCVLNLAEGTVSRIAGELKGGWFGRFDLSFDARRVVFGWKKAKKEGFRIYEIDIDPATGLRTGSKLRQLTFPRADEAALVKKYGKSRGGLYYHHGTDDMHPCYLPDGGIVFISTRCQFGVLCNNDDVFTTTVLYRMDADGRDMVKLSNSAVSESSPCVMPDGRILYTRWEYVEKGHIGAKCLWAMRPDGSGSVEIYGNDITYPPSFMYGRPIPGATGKYVFLGTPHCSPNSLGTVIRIDTSKNIRTREPMTYITPQVDIRAEKDFHFRDGKGGWKLDHAGRGGLFKDPYPLSSGLYLASHKPAGPAWSDPKAYGLYLLDEAGRTRLIYKDPTFSCFQPYPLRRRTAPPVLRTNFDPAAAAKGQALCVVTDVYHGLENTRRGTIRYIRILEQVPRPWSARRTDGYDQWGKAHVVLAKGTNIGLKVQWGIVPVEDDGSAHFIVPADRNIYFQVLDANYLAVQTERSYVNYKPGETRACIGCHETPNSAAAAAPRPAVKALKRPPSVPAAQVGDAAARRVLHFPADVQPVLDKHCIKCHNPRKKHRGPDLRGDPTTHFSISYEALLARLQPGLTQISENSKPTVGYLPARSCFSHNTSIVAMLSGGRIKLTDKRLAARAAELGKKHKDLKLSTGELLKISNWIDANCQFYGSYWGRRHVKFKGRPDYRPTPTFADAISTTPPTAAD